MDIKICEEFPHKYGKAPCMTLARKTNKVRVKKQADGSYCHIYPMEHDEETLFFFFRDVFAEHYRDICFGPMIEGSVWELSCPGLPDRIDLNDGYLTIDFGSWHFHLCIGTCKGSKENPIDEELQQQRKTAKAEFFRRLNQDRSAPTGWGFRCFNGLGEQQITIQFPSPFFTTNPTYQKLESPDWSRLDAWNSLRKRFIDQQPEAIDRRAIDVGHH